jgi:hypothetical protein
VLSQPDGGRRSEHAAFAALRILDLFAEVAEGQESVRNYKVWQDGNHPEILNKKKFINQKLEYLHTIP